MVAGEADGGVPDKFYPAQSAVVLTPEPKLVVDGCWATPKACIEAATERAGLRAQVARLEQSSASDVQGLIWAILGVGVAAGLAVGITLGWLFWGTH